MDLISNRTQIRRIGENKYYIFSDPCFFRKIIVEYLIWSRYTFFGLLTT